MQIPYRNDGIRCCWGFVCIALSVYKTSLFFSLFEGGLKFFIQYCLLLHLSLLRFHCVGGCLEGFKPGLLRLWHRQSVSLTTCLRYFLTLASPLSEGKTLDGLLSQCFPYLCSMQLLLLLYWQQIVSMPNTRWGKIKKAHRFNNWFTSTSNELICGRKFIWLDCTGSETYSSLPYIVA